MREYETLYIAHPEQSESQIKSFQERLEQVIGKQGGQVLFTKHLGKKAFTYPIQKQTKGTYICLHYADLGKSVAEIERIMRLDESILRFLTVMKSEEVDIEARKLELEKQAADAEKPVMPPPEKLQETEAV